MLASPCPGSNTEQAPLSHRTHPGESDSGNINDHNYVPCDVTLLYVQRGSLGLLTSQRSRYTRWQPPLRIFLRKWGNQLMA
jgi:hypothetical protein